MIKKKGKVAGLPEAARRLGRLTDIARAAGGAPRAGAPPPAAPDRRARRARGCCSTAARCCCSAPTTTSASPTTRGCARAAAEAAIRLGRRRRRLAPDLGQHERRTRALEERLAEFKGYRVGAAVRLRLPRQHRRRSPRSPGEGEVVFSDELNHASIIDGCRLARAETFVYRHADVEHLAWGLRKAGDRASLIVTDGVFSMDGDIAPLPELHELARAPRLPADGRRGPRAPARSAPAGAARSPPPGSPARSTSSSARSARRSAPTAPTSAARRELIEYLLNTARPFIFSTALPPPRGRRRDRRRWSCSRRSPSGSSGSRPTPRSCARRSPPRGSTVGDSETQIVPVDGRRRRRRRWTLCERALERGVFAQGIRPPTVPEGSSRLRLTAMATHRAASCGRPRRVDRQGGARSCRAASSGLPVIAEPPMPACRLNGVFVTGTGTEVGKTVVAAAIARTHAAAGETVAVFKPAVTGLDEHGEPDHELLRRAAGSARATRRSPPTATGRPSRRTWPLRWPARRSTRRALPSGAPRRAARAPTSSSARASAASCVPLTPDYLVRDLAARSGAAGRRSPPRPGSARSTTRC